MNCENCGSEDFEEQDGFYYCTCCQARKTGFAKQVSNEEDWNFVSTKEIRLSQKKQETKKQRKERERDFSQWSTLEAFNEIFYQFVEDFFQILAKNELEIQRDLFRSIAMQIWFKYLRESELAFVGMEKATTLHPKTRFRDNFVLGTKPNLNNKDDEDNNNVQQHLPYYSTLYNPTEDQRKLEQNTRGYGQWYTARLNPNLVIANREYFNDDQANSVQYRDPRTYLKHHRKDENDVIKSECNSKVLNRILREKSCSDNRLKENDDVESQSDGARLMDEINRFVANGGNLDQNQEEDEEQGSCSKMEVEEEEKLYSVEDFNQVLRDRMSTKTKLLQQVCSFEYLLAQSHQMYSPLSNDILNRHKLLALLYIVIRLFNFNIYLSDLIRWSREGSICFMNSLVCLPKSWEVMWLDLAAFKSNTPPYYPSLIKVLRSVTIHCKIGNEMFPKPDLYQLIGRYLKDLNLPRDLIEPIAQRYGGFVDYHSRTFERGDDDDFERFPEFEVVAMMVIVLTLRDLFDLFGTNEEKFVQFGNLLHNNDDDDENLFIWPDWIRYSKLRLNLIKIFYLNLNYKTFSENLSNIDDILIVDKQMNDNFRERPEIVTKKLKLKSRIREKRFELCDQFENLFFLDQNFEWKSQIDDNQSPSFYQLISKTDQIIAKISDISPDLVGKLSKDFRNLQTRPYQCKHGLSFHRRSRLFRDHPKFKKSNRKFFDQFGTDSIRHLLELVTIVTDIRLKDYVHMFIEAEQMAYG